MDKINFQNGVTKVNADTFNTFQNNIEKSSVVVSTTQPTTNEKVWFKKGKNYFNKNGNIIKGYYLIADGGINSGAEYFYSADYICVQPNTTYTILQKNADTFRICEYTANKAFIKRDTSETLTYTFTTGSTTYFLRISSLIINLDSLQLELGPTASVYEAYIEPTVLVKNGSIFEEFILKNEKKYSVTEQAIGTWIDGKTVYRKIIEVTSPAVDDTSTNIYNISNLNIKEVIKIEGTVYSKGASFRGPINSYINATDYITTWLYCEDTNKPSHIRCKCHNRGNSPMKIILEYTKN